MPIVINTFGFAALTEAVNQMQQVPSFIRDLLFKRKETHATKTVLVDVIVGGQKIAPFVKRGNAAKVVGNLGVKASQVEPPQIRLKKFLTPGDLFYTRGAGAPIFVPGGVAGNDPIQSARMQKMAMEQKDLKDNVDRTIELLCAKALGGSYSLVQDDGTYSIDFSMPAANKPTLTSTAKWDAPTTCTPLKNMRAWKTIAQKASGKIPTIAIMNSTTFELWLAADEVVKYLDKLKINLGSVETQNTILEAGAEKRAKIDGLEYYVYDGVYTDANGAQQPMIPNNVVALVSPNADHRLMFAGMEDLEAGTVVGEYFSKDWVEKDPSGLWLLVESHPLPSVLEPAANIYATVA
ncbi:MAG: major capsid protein [Ignavibacterium sp.]|nr:major capsid protein [Ignavibacterium sp.]